ncbi:hypothetical protein SAMN05444008_103143 [Cnuella takakiae]|uniref:Cellulase (Glycosyl hydrolase family 5) n=1 Tax=Cnuella takakiae TaxID=1302690 RepID=A0A1M4WU63_9BACT|nr:hypothetical protein [Cnuella takakiae]OLY94706.1 hypothetical protein BUE76_06680 [Cnuella takakiae]SHE84776.1 hypothetical protein SAMN05444008_103143 [Cnuella takakiae]
MLRFHTLLAAVLFTTIAGAQQVLRLHTQNPHYFAYQNKPTILVGSGEHYGAVVNTAFDFEKYLQTIAQDGLNTTRLFTGAYVEKLGDFGINNNTLAPAAGKLLLPWKRTEVPGYALGGARFDLEQWDAAYFQRLKAFMQAAAQHNIIVEVNLFSSHYGGGWNYSALNRANNINKTDSVAALAVNTLQNGNILGHQERYVRKLVRELNGFGNCYFEIQNEPWADLSDTTLLRNEYGPGTDWRNTLQVVAQRSNDWQRKVASWIRSEEQALANKHLIAQNIANFHFPVADADPQVSIFNFHYTLPLAVTENYHLNKVIGFNETGFAGKEDATYRRQAWRFMMAGGALFNHLDYSFWPGSEAGLDTAFKAPGGGSPQLRKQLGVLKQILDAVGFIDLKPDTNLLQATPGASVQAMGNGSNKWLLYLEPLAARPAVLTLNLPRGNYEIVWTDVVTGRRVVQQQWQGGQLQVPARGDLVAFIRK